MIRVLVDIIDLRPARGEERGANGFVRAKKGGPGVAATAMLTTKSEHEPMHAVLQPADAVVKVRILEPHCGGTLPFL